MSQLMGMAVGRRFDINAVMITIASSAASFKLTQNIDNSIAPTGVRVATTAALRVAVSGGQVNIEAMASDAFSSGLQLTFESMAGPYYVHTTADNFPKTATDININTNINIDINDPKWSTRLGDMASKQRQAAEAAAETKSSRRFTAADLKSAEDTASMKLPSITLFGRSEESTSAFSPTLFGRVTIDEDKTINQKIPASRQTQTNSMNKWERLLDKVANSSLVTEINALNPGIQAQQAYTAYKSGDNLGAINASENTISDVMTFVVAALNAPLVLESAAAGAARWGVFQATRATLSTINYVRQAEDVIERAGVAPESSGLTSRLNRTQLRDYLANVHTVPREQLIQDIESIGFTLKGESPTGLFKTFEDKAGNLRVKIHPADASTDSSHIHIYDRASNSLTSNLARAPHDSPEVHIKIEAIQKESEWRLTR